MTSIATDILKRYWGYDSFRPLQADIIESVMSDTDTIALLPTGGGKSICFQVPALMREGLCLVITPLIALMKDQVEHLKQKDIKAETIYTGISNREIEIIMDNCQFGDYKFLYISPERLQSARFRQRLAQLPVSMIAVDEAHCISQWGHDFRPSYLNIADVRQFFPSAPVLALTATATPQVISEIKRYLSRPDDIKNTDFNFDEHWTVHSKSFRRDNLSYVVRHTDDKLGQMVHILQKVSGSSIVYVRQRQRTKDTAEYLQKQGFAATYYHAGLSNGEKDLRQQAWQRGEVRIMVATNAFGMGIDKPDVRTVIHLDLPDSIEAYFQEAGRAGRDEKQAYAILIVNSDDKKKVHKRVSDNFPPKEFIRRVYEAVGDWLEVGLGSGLDHTFAFPLEKFCADKHLPILPTYSALQILSNAKYLTYTDETETNPRVQFLTTRDQLYNVHLTDLQDKIVSQLLRQYTGIFADPVYIHDDRIAEQLGIRQKQLNEELIGLAREHHITYIPRRKTPYITYTLERQPLEFITLKDDIYQTMLDKYTTRLTAMTEYAYQSQFCRSQLLLSYFGQTDSEPCGQCDVCRKKKTDTTN